MCRWQSKHELPDGRAGATEHRTAAHRDLLPEEGPSLRATRCEFPQGLRAEFPVLPLRLISALAEGGDQLRADGSVA